MSGMLKKIFIINLKKDIEKKIHMKGLCDQYNLKPEFIEAIDGQKLRESEISGIYSIEKSIDKIGRKLSRGEIGCALSHKNIYSRIINENIKIALILEDDVFFDLQLFQNLSLLDKFPSDWELVLLGHHSCGYPDRDTMYNVWFKKCLSNRLILRRPCEMSCGTYGYLINRRGAEILLKNLDQICLPIDHYTGDDKYINLYIVQKPLIFIHKELTAMSNLKLDRGRLHKLHKLRNVLSINKNDSLQKRIVKTLRLYQVSINLRRNIKIVLKRFKPQKKYE